MSLTATLTATVNEEVTFTFQVNNDGTEPVELTFPSGKRAELIVREMASGEERWRYGEDQLFTQQITTATIHPGEQVTERYTWDVPVSGRYTATAMVAADRDVNAEVEFTV